MEYIIYFFTVVLPGTAGLALMWRYDDKYVPVGQNFLPTVEELKSLRDFL